MEDYLRTGVHKTDHVCQMWHAINSKVASEQLTKSYSCIDCPDYIEMNVNHHVQSHTFGLVIVSVNRPLISLCVEILKCNASGMSFTEVCL